MISYYGTNSYLIINNRSEVEYRDYLSQKGKIEFYSIGILIVTIICGVISNLMFRYLF